MIPNGSLKLVVAELFRGGCRVDVVAHDPPVVRFRTPAGEPRSLSVDHGEIVLDLGAVVSRFVSLTEALRVAARS